MKKIFLISFFLLSYNQIFSVNLKEIVNNDFDNYAVQSVDWLIINNKKYLAAAGDADHNKSLVKIYKFEKNDLISTKAKITYNGLVNSVKLLFLLGKYYVALAGDSPDQELVLYEFDIKKETLKFAIATTFDIGVINSLRLLETPNALFLAAAGSNGTNKQIKIYKFDAPEDFYKLDTIAIASFYNGTAETLDWAISKNKYYLAVGGSETNSISQEIRVYSFNPNVINGLNLEASYSLHNGVCQSVNWININEKLYLATACYDGISGYKFIIFNYDQIKKQLKEVFVSELDLDIAKRVRWINIFDKYYLAQAFDDAGTKYSLRVNEFDYIKEVLIENKAQLTGLPGTINSLKYLTVSNKTIDQKNLIAAATDKGVKIIGIDDSSETSSNEPIENDSTSKIVAAIKKKYC